MGLIEGHSEEVLFSNIYFFWTNSSSLGALFISSTSCHYVWAFKIIRFFKIAAGIK
nr:ClbS/DfsB family four-helix bundle protein [Listeria monocytogenes]